MGLFDELERMFDPTWGRRQETKRRELQERQARELAAARAAQAAQIEAARKAAVEREKEEQRKYREEYPCPSFLKDGIPTIGIVGETGVGKSSLINALLGRHVAKTGTFETTELPPKMFEANLEGMIVRVADLPGGDTEKYTSDKYFRDVGMRHFACVVVLAAGKPHKLTLACIGHLKKNSVPVVLAVNKMDTVVNGVRVLEDKSDEEAFAETKGSYEEALTAAGLECPVFLISASNVYAQKRRQSSCLSAQCALPFQDDKSINRQWNLFCDGLEAAVLTAAAAALRKSPTEVYQWGSLCLIEFPALCGREEQWWETFDFFRLDLIVILTSNIRKAPEEVEKYSSKSAVPTIIVVAKCDYIMMYELEVQGWSEEKALDSYVEESSRRLSKFNYPIYFISAVAVEEECGSLDGVPQRRIPWHQPMNRDWLPLLQCMKREAIKMNKFILGEN